MLSRLNRQQQGQRLCSPASDYNSGYYYISWRLRIVQLALLFIAGIACSCSSDSPLGTTFPENKTTAVIGASGGQISLLSGLMLVIPEGAFQHDVTLTVTSLPQDAEILTGIRVETSEGCFSDKQFEIILPLPPSNSESPDPGTGIPISWRGAPNDEWSLASRTNGAQVYGTVIHAGTSVSFFVDHFSDYAVSASVMAETIQLSITARGVTSGCVATETVDLSGNVYTVYRPEEVSGDVFLEPGLVQEFLTFTAAEGFSSYSKRRALYAQVFEELLLQTKVQAPPEWIEDIIQELEGVLPFVQDVSTIGGGLGQAWSSGWLDKAVAPVVVWQQKQVISSAAWFVADKFAKQLNSWAKFFNGLGIAVLLSKDLYDVMVIQAVGEALMEKRAALLKEWVQGGDPAIVDGLDDAITNTRACINDSFAALQNVVGDYLLDHAMQLGSIAHISADILASFNVSGILVGSLQGISEIILPESFLLTVVFFEWKDLVTQYESMLRAGAAATIQQLFFNDTPQIGDSEESIWKTSFQAYLCYYYGQLESEVIECGWLQQAMGPLMEFIYGVVGADDFYFNLLVRKDHLRNTSQATIDAYSEFVKEHYLLFSDSIGTIDVDLCEGVDCSGLGECVIDDAGLAVCVCEGTAVSEGLNCVCSPECEGKDCGEDGCGGSCGTCENGGICVEGHCSDQPEEPGHLRWAYDLGFPACSSLVIADSGRIIVTPDCGGGDQLGRIVALDLEGNLEWMLSDQDLGFDPGELDGCGFMTASGQLIAHGSGPTLISIDLDGNVNWINEYPEVHQLRDQDDVASMSGGGFVMACGSGINPGADDTCVFSEAGGLLAYESSPYGFDPRIGPGGVLYSRESGVVEAWSLPSLELQWTFEPVEGAETGNGTAVVPDSDGSVYVTTDTIGGSTRWLYKLSSDGLFAWKHEFQSDLAAEPRLSATTVYVGATAITKEGELVYATTQPPLRDFRGRQSLVCSDGTRVAVAEPQGAAGKRIYYIGQDGHIIWEINDSGWGLTAGPDGNLYMVSQDELQVVSYAASCFLDTEYWPKWRHDNRLSSNTDGPLL